MNQPSVNSVAQSCATLCDPMNRSTPGFPAAAAAAKSLQSCLTLCDPINGSPPGSSVHEILQVTVLAWVPISFSRGLPDPEIESRSPALQMESLPYEPPGSLVLPRTSISSLLQSDSITQGFSAFCLFVCLICFLI